MKPQTRHCDECRHFRYTYQDVIDDKPICAKGHTPRFYMPRFAADDDCGFKRRCAEFEAISDLNRNEGTTP